MRALLLATLLLASACDDEIEVEIEHKLCATDADCTVVAIDCCCEFRGVNLTNAARYESLAEDRLSDDVGDWAWCGCECPSEPVKCGDGRCYAEREWLTDDEYYSKREGPRFDDDGSGDDGPGDDGRD